MPKKIEPPQINNVVYHYNGDRKMFKNFFENMAVDYINSDILPEYLRCDSIDCVDFSDEKNKILDK